MAEELYFTIKRKYAQMIYDGLKYYECRAATPKLMDLVQRNVGRGECTVFFHWYSQKRLKCQLLKALPFENIGKMLQTLTPSMVLPDHSLEEALASCMH
eukprot:s1448_g14.t1